jgi:hypothetical protein
VNPFHGLCINEQQEMLTLWHHCSRGSLRELLMNNEIKIDVHFQCAFTRDISAVSETKIPPPAINPQI